MAEQALETENASVGLPPVAATPDQRSVTRLNINISRETAEALRALAKDENTSVTNVGEASRSSLQVSRGQDEGNRQGN